MASIHITPHPAVIIVQAGIFIANLFVIKKLILEPYLKVRDKRDSLTTGSHEETDSSLRKCESLARDIETRLSEASMASRVTRDKLKTGAANERGAILAKAEEEAKAAVEAVRKDIESELEAERAKVPSVVSQLTNEVFELATS